MCVTIYVVPGNGGKRQACRTMGELQAALPSGRLFLDPADVGNATASLAHIGGTDCLCSIDLPLVAADNGMLALQCEDEGAYVLGRAEGLFS